MLKIKFKKSKKKNNRGMALVEALPVLFMVILIFNFTLGFFGSIHSGILNSIGSYNYTMETFRFRANLMYFRPGGGTSHYAKSMNRVHGVIGDGYKKTDFGQGKWPVTIRNIAVMPAQIDPGEASADLHGKSKSTTGIWKVLADYSPESDQDTPLTSEIWVKTVYGICLSADCKM